MGRRRQKTKAKSNTSEVFSFRLTKSQKQEIDPLVKKVIALKNKDYTDPKGSVAFIPKSDILAEALWIGLNIVLKEKP